MLGALSYKSENYVAAYDRAKRAIALNPEMPAAYRLKSRALVASFIALSGKVLPPGARGDLLVEAVADLEKYASMTPQGTVRSNLEDEASGLKWFADYYALPENRLQKDVTAIETPDPDKTALRILSKAPPGYTDSARERNVQGTVILMVAFDASGKIGPIMVIKSLDQELDHMSIVAARKITFTPPTKHGVPHSVVKQLEYTFAIY